MHMLLEAHDKFSNARVLEQDFGGRTLGMKGKTGIWA